MALEYLESIITEEDWEAIMEAIEMKENVKSKNGCFSY